MFLNNTFSQSSRHEPGSQMSLRSSILQENHTHTSLHNIHQNQRSLKSQLVHKSQKSSSNQILRKKDKKAQDKENQSKSRYLSILIPFQIGKLSFGFCTAKQTPASCQSQSHDTKTNYSECVSYITRNNKRQKVEDSRN